MSEEHYAADQVRFERVPKVLMPAEPEMRTEATASRTSTSRS